MLFDRTVILSRGGYRLSYHFLEDQAMIETIAASSSSFEAHACFEMESNSELAGNEMSYLESSESESDSDYLITPRSDSSEHSEDNRELRRLLLVAYRRNEHLEALVAAERSEAKHQLEDFALEVAGVELHWAMAKQQRAEINRLRAVLEKARNEHATRSQVCDGSSAAIAYGNITESISSAHGDLFSRVLFETMDW
eukprot:CAMPEP_0172367300 /NCGR_PEP_ID=MMETSP1060-20121228/20343_1 /TAXON_ID=37318 /ORGANISM="Pseudo-nitzschia pungens, Strain cf. cingulata" /LENGTH=196 /DNA_ID=CAMNT_0013091493 /DNA_START=553 /DNA_END=1140 /DNA_ORIENTATION=+